MQERNKAQKGVYIYVGKVEAEEGKDSVPSSRIYNEIPKQLRLY